MTATEPLDRLIEAYAKLVVRIGVNVQFGQRVVIRGAVEHAPVARVIAQEAYRAGASLVTIDYTDPVLTRAAVDHAPQEQLGRVLPHQVEGIRAWREDRPALITLTGNPHPTLMEGADPARLAASMPIDLMKEFLPIITTNLIAWTVVGAPNPAWAQTVLGEPDVDRLWQAVAVAMRLDQDDPVDAWKQHIAKLHQRRDLLNARGFDRIRYRGPGTDLTVGLVPGSSWMSGAVTNDDGTDFVPNMPTEEVFTSPDWRRADGNLTTTAPFFLAAVNTLVDGLRLDFHDGTIRGAAADRGEVAVQTHLDGVPRARHLGEVAIVDGDSAVRRTGLTYSDMLYDENAGSHVAFGSGFATTIQRGTELSPDERIEVGVNQSNTHVDVVVGSPAVEIDGIDADGRAVPITRGDVFVLDTA
ncbi:MAG TPA: aminopeptidase [Jatrophihabitans sp.]|jgi:aminopeptidase|uniref:aminopeptidase n=1 Tax=Jatrophihabitans sp. TaxID=1932789 RepID=UPI002E0073C5|nr:aminopeptidase [Jatrophihabitans sp.]